MALKIDGERINPTQSNSISVKIKTLKIFSHNSSSLVKRYGRSNAPSSFFSTR